MAKTGWEGEIADGHLSPLRISEQTMEFLVEINKKYTMFVIDGIVFDASIGHVCSCIGLDASNLGIKLAINQNQIGDFDPKEFMKICYYIMNDITKKFDNSMNFYVLRTILGQIYEDGEFKHLQIIVRKPDIEDPLLMAKCV